MLISIVINYFNNETALSLVLDSYKAMSSSYPNIFEIILVDDHSTEPMDGAIFEGVPNLRVFRVREDVPWNMPGARNIGAVEARSRKIFFTDVDHIIEADDVPALIKDAAELPLGKRLTPARKRAFGKSRPDEALKVNINCFLINRQDFFRVGGYEEMFSGHYGHEDKYFNQCCRRQGIQDDIASFNLSYMTGHSTKGLDRDKSYNDVIIDTLLRTNTFKASKTFTFNYDQTFPSPPPLPPLAELPATNEE